jgi:hypothetical protein
MLHLAKFRKLALKCGNTLVFLGNTLSFFGKKRFVMLPRFFGKLYTQLTHAIVAPFLKHTFYSLLVYSKVWFNTSRLAAAETM